MDEMRGALHLGGGRNGLRSGSYNAMLHLLRVVRVPAKEANLRSDAWTTRTTGLWQRTALKQGI